MKRILMKLRKSRCLKIILFAVILFTVSGEQTMVYAKTIDIKNYLENDYNNQHVSGCRRLTSAIGGMRARRNTNYRNFYKVGKKMYIGANNSENAAYPRRLTFIKNNGNKKIRYYGVKIGDSYSRVKRKLARYHMSSFKIKKGVYTFANSNAESLKTVFRNGKLKSFTYVYAYTS